MEAFNTDNTATEIDNTAPTKLSHDTPQAPAADKVVVYWNICHELIDAVATRKEAEAQKKIELLPYANLVADWKARMGAVESLEDSTRDEVLKALEALEAAQAEIMAAAVKDPAIMATLPQIPDVPGIGFQWRQDVVIDPQQVPREWCVPDATRIRKAVLAGVPIPGAVVVQKRGVVVR